MIPSFSQGKEFRICWNTMKVKWQKCPTILIEVQEVCNCVQFSAITKRWNEKVLNNI